MVIFDLPNKGRTGHVRAAALGSCRVVNPIFALRDRGDVRICAAGLAFHHGAVEALQSLKVALGDLRVPDFLSPYIFSSDLAPSTEQLERPLRAGVDVFILEISSDRQFWWGDFCLQQTYLSVNLVQTHRGALLEWFRELCRGKNPDEACVQTALDNLRKGGFEASETRAKLLRGVRSSIQGGEEITDALREMISTAGGRWIVVGAFDVPGQDGPVMADRRVLNAKVEAAAKACGAVFYDPTQLIIEHGRATALDGGGADIYEYAPSFNATVGDRLVGLVRAVLPAPMEAAEQPASARWLEPLHRKLRPPFDRVLRSFLRRPPAGRKGRLVAPRTLAERLNAELVDLHRRRLSALGSAESGLHAYYQGLVEHGSLIGRPQQAAVRLIEAYLPKYDSYAVLRAGLGELAFLLAASGHKVMACEPDRTRRSALEAGAKHLERLGLVMPGALKVLPTLVPEGPLSDRVLGVGLDVVHFRDEASAAPALDRMGAFQALFIDLRTFLRLREDAADNTLIVDGLRALGFDFRRDFAAEGLSWFAKPDPSAGS